MNWFDAGWLVRIYALQLFMAAVLPIGSALVVCPRPVKAVESKASNPDAVIAFDIASLPLEDALYAFGAATGIEVFVDGGAVTGRRSTGVKGSFTAAQALHVLLNGTGLDAQPIGARAITLSPGPQQRSSTAVYRSYSAMLQNAVLRRLCGEGGIAFGAYRIAMQLWLTEAGTVRRIELLSSTGDQARDHRISNLLEGISAGKPPPILPQPVVMVILPLSIRDSGDCIVGAVQASSPDVGDGRDSRR
jgi:secretin/TonB-like protein